MRALRHPSPKAVVAGLMLLCASGWLVAAGAQDAPAKPANPGNVVDNTAVFIDGRTFQVTSGTPAEEAITKIKQLNARSLGPAAIVFRSGDQLYVAGAPLPL